MFAENSGGLLYRVSLPLLELMKTKKRHRNAKQA
jgi:hypothetical protein